ncbi:glycerophosphodiester phosphodiesterase [Flavisolibacter nicotianae]|uniref:glycerophosphodiester phosphodiesterase n=1 Tax=Flavisolibacter nicotianae TaxID=2364882 RepID=UPI000EABB2E7|nr:glycerophosphodiester phosphodiesterase [Flavisolibacter nicotianae]
MKKFYPLLLLFLFVSCQELIDAPVPSLYWERFEAAGARPLSASALQQLEGRYQVQVADDDFGDSAIVKWTYDIQGKDTSHYLSFFCKEDVRYFILQGKSLGDSILLNGYWRNVENTKTGKAHFVISSRDGAFAVHSGAGASPGSFYIKGRYGMFDDEPQKEINFRYDRPLYSGVPFQIVAHRGGGRNNDLLPASENSLEMIHLASRFGATGIEIDVQLTKDSMPVLFHDANLNDRLTHKTGIHGTIDSYTFDELQRDVVLKRGGKIPTLQDALHTVVYNTPLQFVWLDCKLEGALPIIRGLQKRFMQEAMAIGRNVEIVIGVPDKEMLRQFLALPGFAGIPSLCELEPDSAKKMNAKIWAPAWAKGLQTEDVQAAQAMGMRAITWTLDAPRKIKEYMRHGRFNGLTTNRSTAVAYEYYSRPL